MAKIRWPDGVVSRPATEKESLEELARAYLAVQRGTASSFRLRSEPIFEDSPIPLRSGCPIWLVVNCKNRHQQLRDSRARRDSEVRVVHVASAPGGGPVKH